MTPRNFESGAITRSEFLRIAGAIPLASILRGLGVGKRGVPSVYVPTQKELDTSCLPRYSWLKNDGVWKLFGIDIIIDPLRDRKLPLGEVAILCGDTGTGPSPHEGIDPRSGKPINGFDDFSDGNGHGILGAGLCLDFNPPPVLGETPKAPISLIDVRDSLVQPARDELSNATLTNPHAAILYTAISPLGELAERRIEEFVDASGTVICSAGNGGHCVPGKSAMTSSDPADRDSVTTLPSGIASTQTMPQNALWHPATVDGVIAAVSVDGLDQEGYLGTPDPTSSPGGAKPYMCLAAPGRHLSSTAKGGDKDEAGYYTRRAENIRGTSFAAPNLAAFFALLASIHLGHNPEIAPRQAVLDVVDIALRVENCRHPGEFDKRYDGDDNFCARGVPQADRILQKLGIHLHKIYVPLVLTPDRSQSTAVTNILNTKISSRGRRV